MSDVTLRYLLFGEDKTASKALKGVGKNAEGALGSVKKGVGAIAAGLGAVGIAAFAKSAVDLEAKFGQTMSMIAAATHAPASEMKDMNDLAMKLGAATSFSAGEAADAMLELAKSGLDVKTIMGGGVQGTLTLAAAGGTELATAATIASNAMNTFNLKGKDMAKVAAALAGGANASSASVESLGQGLQQVGPGATNAGLSLQETVAVLSAFDAAGIKGSDAGTSLKTMLTRLVPTTKKAKDGMKELGLSFVDAHGNFKSISAISEQLHDKMSKLSEAERTKAMATIFGSDASRAATVLMHEGSKGLKEFITATNDQTAAQKMAEARMSGTKGALERMSGAIETAQLALGQALAPAVVKVANMVSTQLVPAFVEAIHIGIQVAQFIGDHATAAKALTVAIVALVAITKIHTALLAVQAAGGLAAMIKGLPVVTALTKTWAAVQWILNAALSANPIGLIVIGIAALVAGLIIAYKKSDTFRRIVDKAFRAVGDAAMFVFGWVKRNWPLLLAILTGPIGIATLIIVKNWDRIKSGAMAVVNFVKSIPSKLKALGGAFGDAGRYLIDKFLSGLSKAGSFVGDFAAGVWEAVRSMINSGIDKINGALEFTIDLPGPKNLHVDVANIPHLASGGIVRASRGGTLAVLGEGGRDEAVIPLGRGGSAVLGGGDPGEVVVVVMNESGEVIERKLAKVKRSKRGARTGTMGGPGKLAFEG